MAGDHSLTRALCLQILHADFDEEDTAYLLTVSIAKSGVAQPVKTMKKASPAKTMASKQHEKPKPREPPKEKPKPKPKAEPREESYFETEEYEVCFKKVFSFTNSNCVITETMIKVHISALFNLSLNLKHYVGIMFCGIVLPLNGLQHILAKRK